MIDWENIYMSACAAFRPATARDMQTREGSNLQLHWVILVARKTSSEQLDLAATNEGLKVGVSN